MQEQQKEPGRDLRAGVPLGELRQGQPVFGSIDEQPALMVRTSSGIRALGAVCTHYSGPLADGLVTGDIIRCPWHHACFSLESGEAVAAPALNPLPRWHVDVHNDVAYVAEPIEQEPLETNGRSADGPSSVVIVGVGAAGSAAAEMLRRQGYERAITIVDPDADAPYDRPNLSKDYLAGTAPAEWLPLRAPEFYPSHRIERVTARVVSIDIDKRQVQLSDGTSREYGALLLATGASPIKPPIPGADLPHVHVLRSLADCMALLASAESAKRVLVAGASFIGMEAAAALRQRGLEVTVVAPEEVPFVRTLGAEIGAFLRAKHEQAGVQFRLGRTVKSIAAATVTLDDDSTVECDVVLLGIGVRPLVSLAEAAGLECDNGVVVNEFLQTSADHVFAAGDIARVRDARSRRDMRVEHWVVAQRQGQTAARNILGQQVRYESVPFFWTQQLDVPIAYVGHAAKWDEVDVDGSLESGDCRISYRLNGAVVAVVTVGRDLENLRAEVSLEAER